MDLKQELRDLAADGDDASVSLMRDLVIQNPEHAHMAIKLWTDIGTDEAEHSIFMLMKEYPAALGTEGIQALEKMDNDNGLADIYNFISLVEMEDKTKFLCIMDALDVLGESKHRFSDQIYDKLLDIDPLIPALRIDVLRERAKEGEEQAVDEIGKIASLCPANREEVFDALLDIGTDHAKEVYEAVQLNIDPPPDMDFLGDMGIEPLPDDDSPADGPVL